MSADADSSCKMLVEFRLLTLWTEPLKTAAVFFPVLCVLTFMNFMSLISGICRVNQTMHICNSLICLVFAISCLTMLCGSLLYKLYHFVMVIVLAKLPEDTSNRLTEVGNWNKILFFGLAQSNLIMYNLLDKISSWNLEIDEEDVKTYLEVGSTIFNKFALKLKSVLELANIPESVLFGFNCYFLTLVGETSNTTSHHPPTKPFVRVCFTACSTFYGIFAFI